jgi:hypothetical protein
MEALSCLFRGRRKEPVVARCGVLSALAVLLVTAGFLVGCVHATTTNYAGFQGESDDWAGSCPAEFTVGKPVSGTISATLAVICHGHAAVEEVMSGPFVLETGHYHAVVTGIRTAPDFSYDADKSFDLALSSDGCSMAGTVTDADGKENVSFDSPAEACP